MLFINLTGLFYIRLNKIIEPRFIFNCRLDSSHSSSNSYRLVVEIS